MLNLSNKNGNKKKIDFLGRIKKSLLIALLIAIPASLGVFFVGIKNMNSYLNNSYRIKILLDNREVDAVLLNTGNSYVLKTKGGIFNCETEGKFLYCSIYKGKNGNSYIVADVKNRKAYVLLVPNVPNIEAECLSANMGYSPTLGGCVTGKTLEFKKLRRD